MNASGASICQNIPDSLRALHGEPLPNGQQLPEDWAHQQVQQTYHVWTFAPMVLGGHAQEPIHPEPSHGQEIITGQRYRQRGLSVRPERRCTRLWATEKMPAWSPKTIVCSSA